MVYMVSGNNLFGQWFLNKPTLDKFETVTKLHDHTSINVEFDAKSAKLVNMSWSYNIFQCKNKLYVTGAWKANENVAKLDNYGCEVNVSDLLAVGNDYNLYIVDVTQLKLWILNFGETSKVLPQNLYFEYPIGKAQKGEYRKALAVAKIIASNKSIYFLTNQGYVFAGVPPSYLDTSHCIGAVCDIDCGYSHCMLLTDIGQVYTWGCGKRLQLGHGDVENVVEPKEVDALAGIRITRIAAGGFHCLALSEFGDVYAWGWNDQGQLGMEDPGDGHNKSVENPVTFSIPKLIDIYDEIGSCVNTNIVDIACGSRHSAIKLEDKTVWTSGYNKYGQLGLPSKEYPIVKSFRKVYNCDFDFNLICGTWTTVLEGTTQENIS